MKVQWESQVFKFLLFCRFVEEMRKSLRSLHTGEECSNTHWRQAKNYCCAEAGCSG